MNARQPLLEGKVLPLTIESVKIRDRKVDSFFILQKAGVRFTEPFDDLFINCTLPDKWSITQADDFYWFDVWDVRGVKDYTLLGKIFYKYAWYQRSAHMVLMPDWASLVNPH